MAIFRLEAIVDILTSKAVKELDNLDARGKRSAQQMENLQKRIDRAGLAAEQKAKRIAELRKVVEAGGAGADNAAKQIAQLERSMALAAARTDRLKGELAGLKRATGGASSGIEKFAQSALRLAGPAVLGALSVAIVKLGAETWKFATTMHDAMLRFRAATGATAAETKKFGDALQSLYSNGKNVQELTDIEGALRVVKREFGDLGSQLEPVTQRFLDFARVNEVDVKDAVDSVKDALEPFGLSVRELVPVTHRLQVVSQATGTSVLELARAMHDGAPLAKGLGLSWEQLLSVLGGFEDKGVKSEVALKGLNKLFDAARDGGEKNAAVFRQLGLEVDAMGRPVDGAKAALGALLERMADGEDAAGDLAIAGQLVGDKLRVDFVNGAAGAKAAMADFAKSFDGPKDAVTESVEVLNEQFGVKAELIFRKHFSLTGEMGKNWSSVIEFILEALDGLLTGIEDMGTFLGNVVNSIEASFAKIVAGVQDMMVGAIKVIKQGLASMLDLVVATLDALPQVARDRLGSFRDDVAKTAEGLHAEGRGAGGFLSRGIGQVAEGVKDFLPQQMPTLAGLFDPTKPNIFSALFSGKAFSGGAIQRPQENILVSDEERKAMSASKLKQTPTVGPPPPDPDAERQATLTALKDFEFYIAKKKALNEMSTEDELRLVRRVLAERKFGGTQLVLEEEERRNLLLRGYRLEQDLVDEAARKRTEAADKRKQEAEQVEKLEADLAVKLVTLAEGELAGKIAALDREKAEYLKIAQDKAQVEQWYQLERKKLEDDANKKLLDSRKDLTKRLEQETLQALGLTRQLQLEQIKATALEAKEKGVDPKVISDWLAAKEKEMGPAPSATPSAGQAAAKEQKQSGGAPTPFAPGDVAGAFEGWGTKPDKWEGFASSRREKKAEGPADLTGDQVRTGFAGIRSEVLGGSSAPGGGLVARYAQKYGAPGAIPTEEQLANRQGAAGGAGWTPPRMAGGAALGAAMFDATANANANLSAAMGPKGGASFGAANELGAKGQFAPPKTEGPAVKVQVELTGTAEFTGTLSEDGGADIGGHITAAKNLRVLESSGTPPGL